jgi:amino-acid N-acetyltransferase
MGIHSNGVCHFASAGPSSSQLKEELAKEHVKNLSSKEKAKKEAKTLDRVYYSHKWLCRHI